MGEKCGLTIFLRDVLREGIGDEMRFIACLTIVAFVVTGCTTLRPIEWPAPPPQAATVGGDLVMPGDRVRITTIDGRRHDLTVISISDDVITGKDETVEISEISKIERRTFSVAKTTGLAAGILLGVGTAGIVWLIYILTSWG